MGWTYNPLKEYQKWLYNYKIKVGRILCTITFLLSQKYKIFTLSIMLQTYLIKMFEWQGSHTLGWMIYNKVLYKLYGFILLTFWPPLVTKVLYKIEKGFKINNAKVTIVFPYLKYS